VPTDGRVSSTSSIHIRIWLAVSSIMEVSSLEKTNRINLAGLSSRISPLYPSPGRSIIGPTAYGSQFSWHSAAIRSLAMSTRPSAILETSPALSE
jgi:hypothetical protein